MQRIDLYSRFEKPLTRSELTTFREFVKRAANNEPVQMIIGEVVFCGLTIKVNSSSIVPRPETELLAELILKEIKNKSGLKILDIGTGTGCLALALAKFTPVSEVHAIDISPDAIELAKINASINNIQNVTFICHDVSTYRFSEQFDIIVSNPPYIEINEYEELEPEVKAWEPRNALTDEGDGLKFYHLFGNIFRNILKPGGKFYLETGWNQNQAVRKIFNDGSFSTSSIKDFQAIERFVVGNMTDFT
jgi:release factor glutamine methyltransferase